jgi:hypothetical protein
MAVDVLEAAVTDVAVGEVAVAAGGSGVAVAVVSGPINPQPEARAIRRIKGMSTRAEISFRAILYMVSFPQCCMPQC